MRTVDGWQWYISIHETFHFVLISFARFLPRPVSVRLNFAPICKGESFFTKCRGQRLLL